jgi:hypothetical protein
MTCITPVQDANSITSPKRGFTAGYRFSVSIVVMVDLLLYHLAHDPPV